MAKRDQPTLFPLVDDARPAAAKSAAARYLEPGLFSGDRAPAPQQRRDPISYRVEYRVDNRWLPFVITRDRASAVVVAQAQQQRRPDVDWRIFQLSREG
jgi:hypothetical protein